MGKMFLLRVVLFVVFSLTPSSLGMVRTYGESCEDGRACLGSHVMCLASGSCGCSSQDEMTYDEQSQSCLVNLGKSCGKDRNCMDGAFCDKDICRCNAGFYAAFDGNCLPKKTYKEPCQTDLECGVPGNGNALAEVHKPRPLVCLQGMCQCDRKSDVYSEERGTCVGLVDSECHGDDCTEFAECRNSYTSHSHMSKDKVNGFSGSMTTCQCRSGYAKTSLGRCGLGFGHSCGPHLFGSDGPNTGAKCADVHFICIDGKCTCKFPMHQVYDERAKECLSLVSGPCTFPRNSQMNMMGPNDFQKCVKNAHCVDRGFYSECECKPGFVVNRSGTCTPDYGRPCEAGDCDPDGENNLFCRNGVCECLDLLQIHDPMVKKCRGLVGSRCTSERPFCVEFASCVIPDPKLPGKCLCDKYSEEQTNRTCRA